jgi:hypothetical protein
MSLRGRENLTDEFLFFVTTVVVAGKNINNDHSG